MSGRLIACAAALGAVALVVVSCVVAGLSFGDSGYERRAAVLADADHAVTTLFTAEPDDASGYVAAALSVTTGALHARIAGASADVRSQVAGQGVAGVGEVVASGVIGDQDSADVDVVMVAQASNPVLLGFEPGARRLSLIVTVYAEGARPWRISAARPIPVLS